MNLLILKKFPKAHSFLEPIGDDEEEDADNEYVDMEGDEEGDNEDDFF